MNTNQIQMTEAIFSDLYNFVEDMNPDQEMCLDYCEAQGITITEDVFTIIGDLLWNKENNWSLKITSTSGGFNPLLFFYLKTCSQKNDSNSNDWRTISLVPS